MRRQWEGSSKLTSFMCFITGIAKLCRAMSRKSGDSDDHALELRREKRRRDIQIEGVRRQKEEEQNSRTRRG